MERSLPLIHRWSVSPMLTAISAPWVFGMAKYLPGCRQSLDAPRLDWRPFANLRFHTLGNGSDVGSLRCRQ